MSNLKQLRSRIRGVKSIQKITQAMQLVAASRLKKATITLPAAGTGLEILERIITGIASPYRLEDLAETEQKFFRARTEQPVLLLVFCSQRGLCGSFNSSIIRKVKADIAQLLKQQKKLRLIVIGKKGYEALVGKYQEYISNYFDLIKEEESLLAEEIQGKIMDMALQAEIGECYIYFNRFKNTLTQLLTVKRLLPVEITGEKLGSPADIYEYEGKDVILNIIALYLYTCISFALLENRASEEGARMAAMDNATRNARELIDKLTSKLNRTRQAIITKELIEIISGAEL